MHALHVIVHLNRVAEGLELPVVDGPATKALKAHRRRRALLISAIKAAFDYELDQAKAEHYADTILEANGCAD
jgi:hypothetical protein